MLIIAVKVQMAKSAAIRCRMGERAHWPLLGHGCRQSLGREKSCLGDGHWHATLEHR